MQIKIQSFGVLPNVGDTLLYTITNSRGAKLGLCNYGARIVSAVMPDRNGAFKDVVLGYADAVGYKANDGCFGAICGRVANRIGAAHFNLDGKEYELYANDGRNTLHGGRVGFDAKLWNSEVQGDSVLFTYVSADGEEGFPGELTARVRYSLTDENEIVIAYETSSNKPTPANLTNHAYFNLAGHDSGYMGEQVLEINADFFTPASAALLPTGAILPVAGTPLDFTVPTPIGARIDSDDENIKNAGGYDHNYVLRRNYRGELSLAATAYDPASGRVMETYTDLPGIQLYTGNFMTDRAGKDGVRYNRRHGFCLETQYFPNSMAITHFPSPVLKPGSVKTSKTVYKFSVK